jgi:hypothetical protein
MSHDNAEIVSTAPSFINRVVSNDSFKRGIGTAVAGILVAAVVEAIWPSHPNT